jgi:hypothetical protein
VATDLGIIRPACAGAASARRARGREAWSTTIHVLILGGTGAAGRALIRQLQGDGPAVSASVMSRTATSLPLPLTDRDGSLKEQLPPISQFVNRLLALTIDLQNTVFEACEALLEANIEGAIASGTYDVGVETITAASLRIVERRTIYTHPSTGVEAQVIARRDRSEPLTLGDALDQGAKRGCGLLVNGKSHRAAVQVPAPSVMLDDGTVKHSDMVLLHGGTPRGAEKIAACWADARKVSQVVFKPDWTRHQKAAPFKRDDQLLEAMPIGIVVFPGSGVTDNLADKAKAMGIPLFDFRKAGGA